MIFINEIPFYFVIIFGFIEFFALSFFILEMSNINYPIYSLLQITTLRLFLTLIIRKTFIENIFIITLSSVLFGILITWVILRKFNLNIVVFSFLSMLITYSVEMISGAFVQKYLQSIGGYINWWLTGIPHILLLFLIPIIKKGQLICKKKEKDISEMQ